MCMNKEWYKINVKEEVIKRLSSAYTASDLASILSIYIDKISIREIMYSDFWLRMNFDDIEAKKICELAKELYLDVRTEKYGQQGFWDSARLEREIGYSGKWYEFIKELLSRYCPHGGKVLFVGTADGSEIPRSGKLKYYALEQIERSLSNLEDNSQVQKIIGDFEDETLLICGGGQINIICALRCLMPNTRLEPFLAFCGNNLAPEGVIILSHPLSCLYSDGTFGYLSKATENRLNFEIRLKKALLKHEEYSMIDAFETSVEYFYVLKRRLSICSCSL